MNLSVIKVDAFAYRGTAYRKKKRPMKQIIAALEESDVEGALRQQKLSKFETFFWLVSSL